MERVQIAIVEDDAGMRERISRVIQADPEFDLRHAAATAGSIISFLGDHAINVLLVDLGLPDAPGVQVIQQCRRMQPACAVMVLTIFGDEANMLQAFESGASGYLLKDGTEAELATHIRHLQAGGSPLSPAIASLLLRRWRDTAAATSVDHAMDSAGRGHESVAVADRGGGVHKKQPRRGTPEQLSKRESEVLDLVARGFTYNEIAARMGIATSTVQTHIRNIYGKLDVRNRAEALSEVGKLHY